ncbi:MAG: tRNA (N(6)-L-threonylcarbamoyladenosine(37)-C(2))-methylthiotransferase MtaB [Acidobacteria bacterium]|nr:MAG: tRNA (N(6)-L-threonylcarbamoyladenosine(37)-C(2))-methylthiotransferase MtaB [Acidobacteriota bacterium]
MASPTYAIHTMGCKLNFYDSEAMSTGFEKEGFKRTDNLYTADLLLLNTCTVTNNSDAESRNLIRKFRRRNPNGFLVVTGCYAQARTEDVSAMEEIDFVTTNVNKYDVSPIIKAYNGAGAVFTEAHDIMEKRPAEFRLLNDFKAKTRAFIKIQDGCNLRCSYCIIPFVRGNNRSVSLADILKQVDVLIKKQVKEVVLTGIHIGTWGRDLKPRQSLVDLLAALDEQCPEIWIRISSLDSPEIPDRLIELIKNSSHIVPHLHIPLQSGHNATLKRMRRGYSVEQFKERVGRLKAEIPDLCIGADVIVGFPGETEEEFQGTEAFLHSIPMDYLHVFPYSNRSGTRASGMKDQINGRIIKNRARVLREFSARRKLQHQEQQHLKIRPGIIIQSKKEHRAYKVLTDNYVECLLNHQPLLDKIQDQTLAGKRVMVRVISKDLAVPTAEPVQLLD